MLSSRSSGIRSLHSTNPRMARMDWVIPTVNVLYSFFETIGLGVGLVNIFMRYFVAWNFCPNIYFIGIPTGQCNIRRDRCSTFSQCPISFPSVPCATYFDTEHRRLKMRALAKTILSTSLSALNVSSADLRYTPASRRLGL